MLGRKAHIEMLPRRLPILALEQQNRAPADKRHEIAQGGPLVDGVRELLRGPAELLGEGAVGKHKHRVRNGTEVDEEIPGAAELLVHGLEGIVGVGVRREPLLHFVDLVSVAPEQGRLELRECGELLGATPDEGAVGPASHEEDAGGQGGLGARPGARHAS